MVCLRLKGEEQKPEELDLDTIIRIEREREQAKENEAIKESTEV